jgi:hypothetical protein
MTTTMNQIQIPTDAPIIVCFGGGVDSTAMLIAMKRQGIRPDAITFADTGGEKPETYEHVRNFDAILKMWGFPTVTWCRYIPKPDTVEKYETLGGSADLYGASVACESLPSIAFGGKSCSIKWKQKKQDYVIKGCSSGENKCPPHPLWIDAQERGVKPVKLIGYDAGKADLRRSKNLKGEDKDFRYCYPLQDGPGLGADQVGVFLLPGLEEVGAVLARRQTSGAL